MENLTKRFFAKLLGASLAVFSITIIFAPMFYAFERNRYEFLLLSILGIGIAIWIPTHLIPKMINKIEMFN